jgi:DNA-binding response OmpR family regulator
MSAKGRIHIIDDEPVIHDVLGQFLSSEGYEVEL